MFKKYYVTKVCENAEDTYRTMKLACKNNLKTDMHYQDGQWELTISGTYFRLCLYACDVGIEQMKNEVKELTD